MPECAGEKLGKDEDDCSLQPADRCNGYVWRKGRATQCAVRQENPKVVQIFVQTRMYAECDEENLRRLRFTSETELWQANESWQSSSGHHEAAGV